MGAGLYVASIENLGGDDDGDEERDNQLANAHLIAAAPELLEACQTVKTFLDDLQRNTAPGDPLAAIRRRVHGPLLERLDTAIAKATNTTPGRAVDPTTKPQDPTEAKS